jgi:hypothetical protein
MQALEVAVHAHDVEGVIACLAPDIVIRSPITQRIRFVGLDQASDLFRRVFKIVSNVRIYETVGDGEATQVIFWRGRVGRHYLEEANLLRLDEVGRIREMTVFMRPIPGLLALAEQLAASLASRHSVMRKLILSIMVSSIGTIYRLGEPTVVALAGAGVPNGDAARKR